MTWHYHKIEGEESPEQEAAARFDEEIANDARKRSADARAATIEALEASWNAS